MAQTKVYRTKQSYLSMFVRVRKHQMRISFAGGDMNGGGVFTASDKDIQNALERSPRFLSGEIKVIAVYGEPDPEDIKVKEIKEEIKEVNTNNQVKIYPIEINTVQKAARQLVQDFGIQYRTAETKPKLLERAQEFNVQFPGLR